MQTEKDLIQLRIGEKSTVIDIRGGYGLRRRVEALGIRTGSKITKISSHFWRGPITVKANNTVIALGRGIASHIIVRTD